MAKTTLQLLDNLNTEILLLGVDASILIDGIKESYIKDLEKLKPKKRISKPQKIEAKYKIQVVEGGSSFELILDSEKDLDKYLKDKQRIRKESLDKWLKKYNIYPPVYHRKEQYEKDSLEYLTKIKAAGLNFEIKIQSLK